MNIKTEHYNGHPYSFIFLNDIKIRISEQARDSIIASATTHKNIQIDYELIDEDGLVEDVWTLIDKREL